MRVARWPTGVSVAVSESGQTVSQDVSAGQGANSGSITAIAIDVANAKVLIASTNGANAAKPALFRCNLDGSSCVYSDISVGQGANSGYSPSIVVDAVNSKVLVVTENRANGSRAALFRCNLDGTGCTYKDLSAGQGANSGITPSAVIDTVNNKLLVATAFINQPALFRCDLDGTNCTYADISAGQTGTAGIAPSLALDTTNAKLLVATNNGSNNYKPALFRCNLDGTGCAYSDISALQGANSGTSPSIVVDALNKKVLVVTQNDANATKPALFRCDLDGTNCGYVDISANRGNISGNTPSAAIDAVNKKLLVVTSVQNAGDQAPTFYRCNLDGTGCTFTNISSSNAGSFYPKVAWSAATQTLLAVLDDGANQMKPGFFAICAH